MNFVKNVVLWIMFSYAGFMTGYFLSHPKEVKVETEPMTDWKVFYDRMLSDDWQIAFSVGLSCGNDGQCSYDIYLVDGDKWIKFEKESRKNSHLGGCGGSRSVYRFFVMVDDEFAKDLNFVPSKNAKIVVVGTNDVKLVDVYVNYVKKKNKNGTMDN